MRDRRGSEDPQFLEGLLASRKVVVCCGAGGVGKTTTAAALGLAAAELGRRVLVLTIDPARRLVEALGLPDTGARPARVPGPARGSVDAWMLDPKVVFEEMVHRLSSDPREVGAILSNRLYQSLRELVAGMQEYTAAEALYTFVESGAYDLVVLDTPPSRNALEFLDAPRKLSLFLDERIVGVFLPGQGAGILARHARGLVTAIFDRVFGAGFLGEVQGFLAAFSGMFGAMRAHSDAVRLLLQGPEAAFVVVTSPEPAAIEEAHFLQARLAELALPFEGYVLNRSWAYTRGLGDPAAVTLPTDSPSHVQRALQKLAALAVHERALAERDRALLAALSARGARAMATPYLGGAIEDLAGLRALAMSFLAAAPAHRDAASGADTD